MSYYNPDGPPMQVYPDKRGDWQRWEAELAKDGIGVERIEQDAQAANAYDEHPVAKTRPVVVGEDDYSPYTIDDEAYERYMDEKCKGDVRDWREEHGA